MSKQRRTQTLERPEEDPVGITSFDQRRAGEILLEILPEQFRQLESRKRNLLKAAYKLTGGQPLSNDPPPQTSPDDPLNSQALRSCRTQLSYRLEARLDELEIEPGSPDARALEIARAFLRGEEPSIDPRLLLDPFLGGS